LLQKHGKKVAIIDTDASHVGRGYRATRSGNPIQHDKDGGGKIPEKALIDKRVEIQLEVGFGRARRSLAKETAPLLD